MPDFLKKRLQVFVSSTYTDLKLERQAAVEAILTAGHLPAGMELFAAGDESQMEVIRQWIDESDVYLLILGGRYGSIEPKTGKSYTHIEYEYALSQGKPLFACVIHESVLEERLKATGKSLLEVLKDPKEQEVFQKLQEFRELVCSRMIRFWSDMKDIKLTILETPPEFSRREDLMGWVKGDSQVNAPELAEEIARLSKENAELRGKLNQAPPTVIAEDFGGLSFEEMRNLLEADDFIVTGTGSHTNLLEVFLKARESSRFYCREKELEALDKLRMRGLINDLSGHDNDRDECGDIYSVEVDLSQSGAKFLNKYDIWELSRESI